MNVDVDVDPDVQHKDLEPEWVGNGDWNLFFVGGNICIYLHTFSHQPPSKIQSSEVVAELWYGIIYKYKDTPCPCTQLHSQNTTRRDEEMEKWKDEKER